jgi:membrane associated rhomboid family serine protease
VGIPVRLNIRTDQLPLATLALLGACVLAFAAELALSEFWQKVIFEVVSYGPRNFFNPGAPLLSILLHAGLTVLIFNMFFLLVFGAPVEGRTGLFRFLIAFFVSGLIGSVVEMLMRYRALGPEGMGFVGASGAVSGIIALYVYRLWYPRERMLLEPGLLRFGFEVPAAPFVMLWFLKDLLLGSPGFEGHATAAGHWAQTGGFLTGLLTGYVIGFGHEGSRIEALRKKAMARFEKGGKWEAAEAALQKLRDMDPDDANINRDLARLHARQKKKEALLYYRKAVDAYISSDPMEAARLVFEQVAATKQPMSIQVHQKIARALTDRGLKEEARKVMIAALRRKAESTPPYEDAIVFYIMLLIDIGDNKEAKRSYSIFKKRFPESEKAAQILDASKKAPGTIFPVKEAPPPKQEEAPVETAEPAEEQAPLKGPALYRAHIMEALADPWFIATWFFLYILASGLEAGGVLPGQAVRGLSGLGWQALAIALAAFITAERQHRLVRGLPAWLRERKARKEQEYMQSLDLAKEAEAGEEFEEAAEHYELYLERFDEDQEARILLARLYRDKLGSAEEALEHYEEVLENAEPESPLYKEAREAVASLGAQTEEEEAPEEE